MEDKLKHLEFLQNVITRMSTNSFLIKGWTITLVAALLALASKEPVSKYAFISILIVIAFWILDSFFLSQERQYRALYNIVRLQEQSDYSMDASNYNTGDNKWCSCFCSRTLIMFYGAIILMSESIVLLT